jgi:hypothetical protein
MNRLLTDGYPRYIPGLFSTRFSRSKIVLIFDHLPYLATMARTPLQPEIAHSNTENPESNLPVATL